MMGQQFNMSTEEGRTQKELFLATLGAYNSPYIIMVYPEDFDTKAELLTYLDEYNKNKDEADRIIYNDLSEIMVTLSGNIMDAITIVLVAFSSISLVVSVIMIGIITYISVLERTKEIGVLRALGARKKILHVYLMQKRLLLDYFQEHLESSLLGSYNFQLIVF